MTANQEQDALRAAALAAMDASHAPYSKFPVGAALRATDGRIFCGCNVENASFGLAICAERAAVFAAVCAGAREFETITVATDTILPTPPCGACRQVLAEFAPDIEIVSVTRSGDSQRWTLSELCPTPFVAASLEGRR